MFRKIYLIKDSTGAVSNTPKIILLAVYPVKVFT